MILKNLKKSKHERLDITIHLSVAFFAIFLLSLPLRIPRSHWPDLSRSPVITSSMIAGRCSAPWAGKTGAHLRTSISPPTGAPKRFRAIGRIPGSLPPAFISARWINGCCGLEFPTTPARSTRMIAHRICPSTGRFVMPPGFSISGAIVSLQGRSTYMPTTARSK